jgi:ATP-binding cassette subfamily F protein 3
MLTVHSISKSYNIQTILKDISFTLNAGERLGLVGPNGCGKTTLLRILVGEEQPDSGSFHFNPPGLRLGYLPQGIVPGRDETLASFLDRMAGSPEALGARLEALADGLAEAPEDCHLLSEYDSVLRRLEVVAQSSNRMQEALAALGLDQFAPETPVYTLSGGQKTRLALAGVLLSAPQALLLDEPTNHLDIDMLEWFEGWLTGSPLTRRAGILLISHDRTFLDRTVTGILELEAQTHKLHYYAGNYSAYVEQKLSERQHQWQEYTDQQEEIARLRRSAARLRADATFRRGGKADTGDKFARGFFANRSRGTVGRALHIERRLERLMTEERIDKPRPSWQMKLDFSGAAESGRDVLALEGLAVGYNGVHLLSDVNQLARFGQHIVLIGPNGSGKTTLLRTIVGELPPVAGGVRLGSGVRAGYMAQEQETLNPQLDVLETLRSLAPLAETEARAFLHQFLFTGDEVFTPVGALSYGERARLSLACLVAGGCNLLLLDEPINHLDIPSRARFEQALTNFEGTVLVVVHDRYFIDGFATAIWEARQGRLRVLS